MTPDDITPSAAPTRCTVHAEHPAIAYCSRCSRPVCHHCHGSDLRGFCVCSTCRHAVTQAGTPWDDPKSGSAMGAFAHTLHDALRSPTSFWEPISALAKPLPAVIFGLVCIAMGITMQTLWSFVLDPEYEEKLREVMAFELPGRLLKVLVLARVVVIAPLIFFLHTSILNSAIKLAGGTTRYGLSARIAGYACAAYFLRFIPPVFGFPIGQIAMVIMLYHIELAGVLRYCQLERTRAMFVVLGAIVMSILLGLL